MKKFFTSFFSLFMLGAVTAQWSPTTFKGEKVRKEADVRAYYSLDISALRSQLANAQETGRGAKAVEISLPTLGGKAEKFAVYSLPVMAKDLADQYQLGSYVGVGIDDPSKYLRFSLAPNDFQSMIIKGGESEFIEPVNSDKTVYGVHPKTKKNGNGFSCSTDEDPTAVKQIEALLKNGKSFTNQPTNFAKSSDQKYRTMRLAMSVTGEYTQFHGGTVAGALAAINATMTRVNGVFEKDFALHLNVQNFPNIIYTNASTDPYTNATLPPPAVGGAAGAWNLELQQTLTSEVGNANYDIGHLFGASGGGGNAGCIGCVCVNPTANVPEGKGSGYTSPADAIPQGDSFDIDYVAHEMGHQLGGNHTFSMNLEGNGSINMEPGSGSTIMGYAGITGPSTDLQDHSDPYFHVISLLQIEDNLSTKTCDVETTITNNPPVIAPLTDYTIPKGTAFVLTGTVTDPENDPMTYTWEQFDGASAPVTAVTGNNTTGALFRSWLPSTTGNTRYFPKLSSVLNGNLTVPADWETVSNVARTTNFVLTARDNNPVATSQQTQSEIVEITVGNDGPFKVTTLYANVNTPTPINWDVANTTSAPYNVTNVKIDYTTNNGTTWTTLVASTPNDGTENFTFPSTLNGQVIKLRVSSINNVFYAVGRITVAAYAPCDGSAVTGVTTSNITYNSVVVNWTPVSNATYIIRYRVVGATAWQQTTSTVPTVTLSGLTDATNYEVQVTAVCSGTPGAYSASTTFSTPAVPYCTAASTSGQYNYISNVTLGTVNNTTAGTTYSNFTTNPSLQPTLQLNSTNNSISASITVTLAGAAMNGMAVWIDFNKNGTFDANERVLNMPANALPVGTTVKTGTFAVPATALTNTPLRMRVVTVLMTAASAGSTIPDSFACGGFPNGEVEDYAVIINAQLGTHDTIGPKNDIQIYPNPVSDILNITKVSDKASYKIYSAAGQLVRQGNISNGQINVSELIKGGYIITIEEKGREAFTSKFIKK